MIIDISFIASLAFLIGLDGIAVLSVLNLVDSQKVLLDVIRPIEQLLADVAMERLVTLVDILVSIVEIASVS